MSDKMSREDVEGLVSKIAKAGRMELFRIEELFAFTNMDETAKGIVKRAIDFRRLELGEIVEGDNMAISSELTEGERG